jgi:amino acid transporter
MMEVLFLGWYLLTPALGFLVVTRVLLASSMDRVVPSYFARISDKFHTPYVATWVVAALGSISLVVYTLYASILANLSAILGTVTGAFLLVSLGAIVFPYSKRTKPIFESSPIQFRLLGIPVMTIAGTLSTLVLFALTYMFATNSVYGANTPFSIAAVAFEFVSALMIFGVSYLYHKREGLDLMLAFAQIPPE